MNSIYIGDLGDDVNEGDLYTFFASWLGVAAIQSVKVCRNRNPPYQSLHYGYVNFFQLDDAQLALETLNYQPLKGKTCRMMWAEPNTKLRKTNVGNICCKNLPVNYETRQLHNLFFSCGRIVSCRMLEHRENRNSSHGFVQFQTQEEADRAINVLNNKIIGGNAILVEKYRSGNSNFPVGQHDYSRRSIFISGIRLGVTDNDLRVLFEAFGKVERVLVTHSQRDVNQKLGFVWFETEEMADNAVNEMDGKAVQVIGCGKKEKEKEKEKEKDEEEIKTEKENDKENLMDLLHVAISRPKWERVRDRLREPENYYDYRNDQNINPNHVQNDDNQSNSSSNIRLLQKNSPLFSFTGPSTPNHNLNLNKNQSSGGYNRNNTGEGADMEDGKEEKKGG